MVYEKSYLVALQRNLKKPKWDLDSFMLKYLVPKQDIYKKMEEKPWLKSLDGFGFTNLDLFSER